MRDLTINRSLGTVIHPQEQEHGLPARDSPDSFELSPGRTSGSLTPISPKKQLDLIPQGRVVEYAKSSIQGSEFVKPNEEDDNHVVGWLSRSKTNPDHVEVERATQIGTGSSRVVYASEVATVDKQGNPTSVPPQRFALHAIPNENIDSVYQGMGALHEAFDGNPPADRLVGLIDPDQAREADGKQWFRDKLCDGALTQSNDELFLKGLQKTAETLQEFHKRGYAHGDVRPENILTLEQDSFLTDFDLTQKFGEFVRESNPPVNAYRDSKSVTERRITAFTDAYGLAMSLEIDRPGLLESHPSLRAAVDAVKTANSVGDDAEKEEAYNSLMKAFKDSKSMS